VRNNKTNTTAGTWLHQNRHETEHGRENSLFFCGSSSSSTSLSLSEDSTKDDTGSQSAEVRSGSAEGVRWKMEPAAD